MTVINYPQTIASFLVDAINCGYIRIEDNSVYATDPNYVGGQDDRDNYGILFLVDVSADGVNYANEATYTQLGNNNNPSRWNVDIPNVTYYYKIKGYLCTIVTNVQTPLAASEVVFCSGDGKFYSFNKGSGIFTELDKVSDWSAVCVNTLYQDEESLYYEKSSNYVVTKAACHQYYICDRSNNDAVKTWSVYGPTGAISIVPLLTGTFDPTTDNPYLLDLTTLGDGVYVLEINDGNTLWYYPIYDYCLTQICFESLVKDVLCTDTDCVTTCDEDWLIADRQKRDALNQMLSMYFYMLGKINAERLEYLNIFSLETDRSAVLQEIDNIITKFNEIMTRCGVCNEVDVSTTSIVEPPCSNC